MTRVRKSSLSIVPLPSPERAKTHSPKSRAVPPVRAIKRDSASMFDAGAPVRTSLSPDQYGRDLRNITLDGSHLDCIDFTGADMRGGNFSDVTAHDCIFTNADLVDVCMMDSVFERCNFSNARFGANSVLGARFVDCTFAGSSAFLVPWRDADEMTGNIYDTGCDGHVPFDMPPVSLVGLPDVISTLGRVVLINDKIVEK